MKPRRPLFPFDVCWSHVSNLARILGHFYLKSRIRLSLEVSPASFKKARKVDELLRSGKSLSPFGGYYVDYGGDHAFGDSESFGVGLHKILTWQSKLEDSDIVECKPVGR
jgi:hypothetical protein